MSRQEVSGAKAENKNPEVDATEDGQGDEPQGALSAMEEEKEEDDGDTDRQSPSGQDDRVVERDTGNRSAPIASPKVSMDDFFLGEHATFKSTKAAANMINKQ